MTDLATQEQARFAIAQARQHIEDIDLLRVLQEAGVDSRSAQIVFQTEVN